MRLSEQQCKTIRRTARELFWDCTVKLFGSRVDDAARGGDIELLVGTSCRLKNRAATTARSAARLQRALGDQHIDVLIVDPATRHQPIQDRAREQGIALATPTNLQAHCAVPSNSSPCSHKPASNSATPHGVSFQRTDRPPEGK